MTVTLADSVRLTDAGVDILDRRVFPFERVWVHCATVEDVAVAIEQMVTQSTGPLFATTAGLVLAAREAVAQDLPPAQAAEHLCQAGRRLRATRPTNNHIRDAVQAVLTATVDQPPPLPPSATPTAEPPAALTAEELAVAVTKEAAAHEAEYRAASAALGEYAAAFLPDGAKVLTHCWADLYLVSMVEAVQRAGKRLEFVCTETRPFLQGARLTAQTLVEFGYEPTVITDGMVPAALSAGLADHVVVAADRVTMDGHVVNKVGTLAVALAAREFGVPFNVLIPAPDPQAPTLDRVVIEQRDGDEVLHVLGRRSAAAGTRGFYPAFDATPPHLVTRIVTERGAFVPSAVADHFRS